jgi:hypothetical protein
LTKTGIGVNIEWFKNELPLCNPHDQKRQGFQSYGKNHRNSTGKRKFLVLIGMIQPVLQLKILMQNMKRFKSKML